LEIWNGGASHTSHRHSEETNPTTSCAYNPPSSQVQLVFSRASVLTLWSSVVAERLGHQRRTALTLGKAVAGATARLKIRVIGREEWVGGGEGIGPALGLDLSRLHKKQAMARVVLLGKTIPLLPDSSGQLQAALRTLPTRDGVVANEYVAADPAEVENYLIKTFGSYLADLRAAMEGVAGCYEPKELNRIGYQLYEKFQPSGPCGPEGKRGKAALEIKNILAALPYADNHDNNSPRPQDDTSSLRASKSRCPPQSADDTNRIMDEHLSNLRRMKKAVAKAQATTMELASAVANSRQLMGQSVEAMARAAK
jgi:hypothetical protein